MKTSRPLLVLGCSSAALLFLLPSPSAQAQISESLTTSGNWFTAANWNPANVPNNVGATTYSASISGSRTVTLDGNATIQNLNITSGSSPGSTVAFNPGQTLTVNGSLSAGLYTRFTGAGTLILNGGGASSNNAQLSFTDATFNNQAGSVFSDNAANYAFSTYITRAVINNAGTYSMDGAGSSLNSSGAGTAFNNSGTYRGSGYTTLPFTNSGTVTAQPNPAQGSVGVLEFGASGTSSGTFNTGTTVYQGVQFDAGTWNFSSASTNAGAGKFVVAGAAVTINGAHNVTGITQVNSGAGTLTFANANTTVGGILNLDGGTTNFTGANTVAQLNLGRPTGGSAGATLNLGAGGRLNVNGAFNTGTSSTVNGGPVAGVNPAVVTLNGGGSVGDNSAFILNNVTLNNAVGSTLTQANAGGFDNTLQNGSLINNAGTWVLQNQNGRGLVAASGAAGAGAAFNNSGLLTGNVSYTSSNIGFALNNTGTVRLDSNGGSPTLAVGTFTQTAGSTQLSHTNNVSSALLSSSNPIAFQGGSLVGSGQLSGNVVVSGANTQISPGYSIGTINVQGSFTQTGGRMTLELGRTATGAGGTVNDLLSGNGVLSLSNTDITFSLLSGSLALQVGDAFTVLSSTGNGLALTGDTFTFDSSLANYQFTQTQTAGGYTLTLTAVVPEPETWVLLEVGGLALVAATRRPGRNLRSGELVR